MLTAGIILAGLGGFLVLLGAAFYLIGKRLRSYNGFVTGTITGYCRNPYDYNRGGSGNAAALVKGPAERPGDGCMTYSYTINGVSYRRASNIASKKSSIEKRVGTSITVYYDESDPSRSALTVVSPVRTIGKIFLAAGVLLDIVGLIFMLVAY